MLEAALARWLDSDRQTADLLELLACPTPFEPLDDDPRSGTPVFIKNAVYGTLCSTVVLITAAGAGTIIERRFDRKGQATGETRLSFQWALGDGN